MQDQLMRIVSRGLTFIFILFTQYSLANNESVVDSIVSEIHTYRTKVFKCKDESQIMVLNDSLRASVEAFLNEEGTFKLSTDSVPFFGDLYSPDKAFRLLTWDVPFQDGTFTYFCYIQMADGNWFELKDQPDHSERAEYKTFKHDDWLGALYYEIIPFDIKKEQMYLLLGWDGRTNMSNRKVIEVLYFDNRGFPRFGKAVLKDGPRPKRRVILEYTEDAYTSLRYHPDKKMVIFDHLEPMRPELEGVYEFYAPVSSFDAYELKSKEWEFQEDVDAREKKSNKQYRDPRKDKSKAPVKVPKQ